MATFLRHEACPKCGSTDNVSVWWNDELKGETYSCMTPGCSNFKSDKDLADEASEVKIDGRPLPDSWLEKLHLSREVVTRYGILCRDKKVFFPYRNTRGIIKKVKVRDYSIPKDSHKPPHFFWLGDSTDPILFGVHSCPSKKNLILVTGEWDALAAVEMMGKWFSAASIDNGDRNAVKCVKSNLKWIDQFDKVYICFDNDKSGQNPVIECAKLIGSKAYIVTLPSYSIEGGNTKDAKDFRQFYLDDEFKSAIYSAEPYTPEFVYSDATLLTEIKGFLYDDRKRRGYETKIAALNSKIGGLRLGEVSVLMGLPGRGKSTLGRDFLATMIQKHSVPSLYISLEEMGAVGATRVLEYLSGRQLIRNGDGSSNIPPDELEKLYETHVSRGRLVMGKVAGWLPLEKLRDIIYYAAKSRDVKFVLFDHITAATDGEIEQHKAISKMMQQCNILAQELEIHVMVISHTRRKETDNESLEDGVDPVPTIRDAFGGSGVEQYAHLFLAMQAQLSHTKLHILKNRLWGDKGYVTLYYRNGRFTDGSTTRNEMQEHDRGEMRQSIREERDRHVSADSSESSEIRPVYTTEDAEDELPLPGGASSDGGSVPGSDMETRLENTERSPDRDEGGNAGRLPQEGGTVSDAASEGSAPITVMLSRRKPIPLKGQQDKVRGLGDESGDSVAGVEGNTAEKLARVTDLLKKYVTTQEEEEV